MNMTLPEATVLSRGLVERIGKVTDVGIVVAPNFTVLLSVGQIVKGSSIRLAAQNLHFEQKGAFTGETSASMITAVGAEFVIVGHSERRHIFGESDEVVNKKLTAAISGGLLRSSAWARH